ncbi:MAG TPA: hypothetical protein VEG30_13525 [Terriglobales bacterium]|nr:hypothetical protein [Terriglobales bacterium]
MFCSLRGHVAGVAAPFFPVRNPLGLFIKLAEQALPKGGVERYHLQRMQTNSDPAKIQSATRQPIWINPPKFWAATRNMSPDEVGSLMERIEQMAAAGDKEALRKFDFVYLENPRPARRAS